MPLFKSQAQKEEKAREIAAQQDAYNDPNTATRGTGVGANDHNAPGHAHRDGELGHQDHAHGNHSATDGVGAHEHAQHNTDTLGHNNRDGVPQNTAPGTGYAVDTRHGHHGGAVDRAEQHAENAIGARAIHNQVGEKEQEIRAIKAQSSELAEAERIEREAKVHRDRAVAGAKSLRLFRFPPGLICVHRCPP
ncbi:hypothetical protein C8Q72DRAFT_97278 [Fomitopsis betulina]|nr:hypothetical protein C8Q72DRAFT_97278 [Fomitopsis betulina]